MKDAIVHMCNAGLATNISVCGLPYFKIKATQEAAQVEEMVTCKNCLRIMKAKEKESTPKKEIETKRLKLTEKECPYKVHQVWRGAGEIEREILVVKGRTVCYWNREEEVLDTVKIGGMEEKHCFEILIIDECGNPVKPEEEEDKLYDVRDTEYGFRINIPHSGGWILSEVIGKRTSDGRTCIGFLFEDGGRNKFSSHPVLYRINGVLLAHSEEVLYMSELEPVFPKKAVFRKMNVQ